MSVKEHGFIHCSSWRDTVHRYFWCPPGLIVQILSIATSRTSRRSKSSRTLQSDYTMASSVAKRIVIGVDFGTTFSGVAWAISTSNHSGNVELISRWSNSTGVKTLSHKVPTTLRRLGNGDLQWGFLMPPDAPSNEVLRWFKL